MQHIYIKCAKDVFELESKAIIKLSENLNSNFNEIINSILTNRGRVIVCGMGKSGIIGKKIAATLSSTGTPSFFMHPGEAFHGDLGMVTKDDIFLAISNSGETEEVIKLIPFLESNRNTVIAMTGKPGSTLAQFANFHLDIGVEKEACPLQLAPTASTTATLAMGDALAVTLMKARDFQPENFARFHPGGALGRRLLSRVDDEMYSRDLPLITSDTPMIDVIECMTNGRLGIAIISDVTGYGIITDGDIRRALEINQSDLFNLKAKDIMTLNPASVTSGTRIEEAMQLLENKKITSLLVIKDSSVVGIFKK